MTNKIDHESKVTEFPSNESRVKEDFSEESLVRMEAYRKAQEIKSAEIRKLMYIATLLMAIFALLAMASIKNPEIYEINQETLSFINKGYNALILLTIPFLLGIIGAIARLLLSGIKFSQELPLAVGSGLMAAFSWVGIKSGVLLAIVAPHIEAQGIESKEIISSSGDFYTMVLVAIFVGMFSTNLYLFISQRVEQLSSKKQGTQNT